MFNTRFGYRRRRRAFWRMAHYWSVLRLRRKLLIETVIVAVLAALAWTCWVPWVYSSRAVIRVPGLGQQGIDTNDLPRLSDPADTVY